VANSKLKKMSKIGFLGLGGFWKSWKIGLFQDFHFLTPFFTILAKIGVFEKTPYVLMSRKNRFFQTPKKPVKKWIQKWPPPKKSSRVGDLPPYFRVFSDFSKCPVFFTRLNLNYVCKNTHFHT
jgi:hypothetical protein